VQTIAHDGQTFHVEGAVHSECRISIGFILESSHAFFLSCPLQPVVVLEMEEDYEELPWQHNNAPLPPHTLDMNLQPVAQGPDEFDHYLGALRDMVASNHFPDDLLNLIKKEMVGPYNTWLKGLRGQPLEYAILNTMKNIGFFHSGTRRLVIPDANVVDANSRLDGIDEVKKRINYVMHRIQEYRLNTVGSNNLVAATDAPFAEESKDAMDEYQGQATNAIDSILAKLVILANNLYKMMDSATIMCMNHTMLLENSNPTKWFRVTDLVGCEFEKFLYISKPIAMEDSNKFDRHTKLVIFLLDKFRERKFRKKVTSDYLYRQIFFTREDGSKVCTYAYAPIKDNIEQLVYDMVRKEFRGDLWSTILHSGILKDVVQYIKKCVDDEVPDVNEMPRMWSFQDGIYCAETDTFCYYEDVQETFPVLSQGYSTYKFMEGHVFAPVYYTNDETATPRRQCGAIDMLEEGPLVSGLSSMRSPRPSPLGSRQTGMDQYPDEDDFDDDEDEDEDEDPAPPPAVRKLTLEEIQMPNLVKIFRDQGWSQQTIVLKLATLGRTFWPAGALDSCQYWPCDWGVGGSGKSTVQEVFKYLFHWQDVGIFGADQEDTFSRDSLPDKRIIIAPEVRGDNFGCSLAFFLSIVAGDSVRIPVKYGQPRDVENFPVQGLMATNELPKSYLNDPKGSVARRILMFPWPRVISPRDPTLKGRIIKEELPAVLRACVVAYHQLPKHIDVMSDYPLAPEMAAARARLQRASNPMVDFLLSEDYVVLGENQRVEMDTFRKTYNYYVKEVRNERQLPPWNEDVYDYPFRLLRLQLDDGDDNGPPVVVGCSMRVEIQ